MRVLVCGGRGIADMVFKARSAGIEVLELL